MPIEQERVRFVFARLRRELSKLAAEPQARDIHDFRTYSRRLQTLLGELSSAPGRSEKKLLKSLTRLRRRAGRVRDLDVQLAALRSLKTSQEPRRKTELASVLAENRRQQEKRWHRALDRKSLRELRRRLKKAEAGLRLRQNRDPLRLAAQRFANASREQGPITEDILHAYRMAAKRARYLAEFAPKSVKREQLIRRLRRVQDALGDWHDWLVLTLSAEKRFGGVRESSLVAVLRNLTQAKFRHAVQVLNTVRSEIAVEPRIVAPAATTAREPASVAVSQQRAA
jgi:CHAD domain-containing protein